MPHMSAPVIGKLAITRMFKVKLFCFLVVFILSGCASIPLSTMLKFSSFEKSDFVALEPADIKAKIILDQPVEIDIEKVQLGLEVGTEQGSRSYKFPLSLLERRAIPAKEGWFDSDEAKTEYTFNLSSESVKNFKEVQQLLTNKSGGKFGFSVSSGFENLPNDVQSVNLSILLKLQNHDDFVPIFDDATIAIKRDG